MEPVEIVILPAGKSLDVCAKLREEKKVKVVDGLEKKKRRKKNKKSTSAAAAEAPTDMFDFLNTQIFTRGKFVIIKSMCYFSGILCAESKKDQAFSVKKTESSTTKSANLNVKVTNYIVCL